MASNNFITGGPASANSYEYRESDVFPFSQTAITGNSNINKRVDVWSTPYFDLEGGYYETTWINSGYDMIEVWMVGGGGGGGDGDLGSITGSPRTIFGGGGGAGGGISYYKIINPSGNIAFEVGPGGDVNQGGGSTTAESPYDYLSAYGGRKGNAGYAGLSWLGTNNNYRSDGSFEEGQVCATFSVVNISGYIVSGANVVRCAPSAGGYGYSHITGGTFIDNKNPRVSLSMGSFNLSTAGSTGVLPGGTNVKQSFGELVGGNGGAGGGLRSSGTDGGWPGGGGGGGGMQWAGSGTYMGGGKGAPGAVMVIGYKY